MSHVAREMGGRRGVWEVVSAEDRVSFGGTMTRAGSQAGDGVLVDAEFHGVDAEARARDFAARLNETPAVCGGSSAEPDWPVGEEGSPERAAWRARMRGATPDARWEVVEERPGKKRTGWFVRPTAAHAGGEGDTVALFYGDHAEALARDFLAGLGDRLAEIDARA